MTNHNYLTTQPCFTLNVISSVTPGNQEHSKALQNLGKMKTVTSVYQTMLLYTRILVLGFNKGTNYIMKRT